MSNTGMIAIGLALLTLLLLYFFMENEGDDDEKTDRKDGEPPKK